MISYKHTQVGYLMIGVILFLIPFYFWIYTIADVDPAQNYYILILLFFILFILSSFLALKVEIDEEYVKIKFGYGIFKKNIILKEIVSAKSVKNHWYYGWGIRLFLWPTTWIYNVSGFDAVEVIMKNGKIYRIGTDDPENLLGSINQTIFKSIHSN